MYCMSKTSPPLQGRTVVLSRTFVLYAIELFLNSGMSGRTNLSFAHIADTALTQSPSTTDICALRSVHLPGHSPVCISARWFIQHQTMWCVGEGWLAQQAVA